MKPPFLRLPFLLSTLSLLRIPTVWGHGYVHQVTIDGQLYPGNPPSDVVGGSANQISPSIVRQISDEGPVKGASNADMNCGMGTGSSGGKGAALVANAMPGSTIIFDWTTAENGSWPHNVGPILTYLTNCGSTSCAQYDPTNSGWFKIAQSGKVNNSTWVQAQIMTSGTYTLNLPTNLASGNYIIRHEIISLQNAVSVGGAEFYPSCTQITVGGSQSGAPQQSDLVKFPGAYSDNDPGIYDPDVYSSDDPYNQTKMPGPPIASFITGSTSSSSGSGSGSSSGSSSSSSSNPTGGGSSTSSPTSSGGSTPPVQTCGLIRMASSNSDSVDIATTSGGGGSGSLIRRGTHVPLSHNYRHTRIGRRGAWDTMKLSFSAF